MRNLIGIVGLIALCTGCPRRTEGLSDASAPAPAEVRVPLVDAGGEGLTPPVAGAADAGAVREEACVDRWLAAHGLDPYGHPEGTMYAGGTPLFNEATGERTDRLTYVYRKHPKARAACAGQTPSPPQRLPVRK